MTTRRSFLRSGAAAATALATRAWPARAENAAGVTETEIKIGQTMPYSGPASAYGVIGRTEVAYFGMINEQGGVNGRKLKLISVDDGYSPPKTVEQVRRLVEQERVAFLFNAPRHADELGGPAISQRQQGAASLRFRKRLRIQRPPAFSLDHGLHSEQPDGRAHLLQGTSLQRNPRQKSACSIRTTPPAKTIRSGCRTCSARSMGDMVIKEVSYEVSEPTVDLQIVTLQGSGADVFLIAATPKAAAQAIRKAYDIGWNPCVTWSFVSGSIVIHP